MAARNVIDYWEDYLNRADSDQKKRFKLENEIGETNRKATKLAI